MIIGNSQFLLLMMLTVIQVGHEDTFKLQSPSFQDYSSDALLFSGLKIDLALVSTVPRAVWHPGDHLIQLPEARFCHGRPPSW